MATIALLANTGCRMRETRPPFPHVVEIIGAIRVAQSWTIHDTRCHVSPPSAADSPVRHVSEAEHTLN
jgi:hypothetical protein